MFKSRKTCSPRLIPGSVFRRAAPACLKAGTACLLTGAASLIAGSYLYHIALDARTDKSPLLRPSPHTAQPDEETQKRLCQAKEESKRLKEQYEDVYIQSFDHLKLHGYLCRQKKPGASNQWAILVHGYDDSGLWFCQEAMAFYQQGFNLLLPDARGHGKSQGSYVGMGWHDRLDIVNWIHWIINHDPQARIILYGVSMGAATILMALGEPLPSNVKAAIEDCGYTSAWEVLKYQLKAQFGLPAFPALTCAGLVTWLKAGYGLKQADALRCVSHTNIPVLFIHGTADCFVPFEMSKKLYDACQSQKEYLAVEGAVHVRSAMVGGHTYWDKVFQFINTHI